MTPVTWHLDLTVTSTEISVRDYIVFVNIGQPCLNESIVGLLFYSEDL